MSSAKGKFDPSLFQRPSDVLDIVLENISHGICVVDRDYRLVAFNRVMDTIFQLPEGTFRVGLDFREVLRVWAEQTVQSQAMLDRAIRELDLEDPFVFEHDQDIQGEIRWVQLIHNPLPGGGFVRTFIDITERKRAELALQERVEDLRQANIAKDQFLRLVSHDLRSPIMGLVGLLQLMQDRPHMDSEERQKLLGLGVNAANSLVSLTDHLLKVSRIKSGALIPYKLPVEVAPLVAEIHTRHQASLHSKGISCDIDIRPDMRWLADRVLIGEVFDNLFSNALKFCDQGDRILVCQVQQDTVEFRDSGPGVLEAFRAGLFRHEIKTVGRGSRGEVGTGMGLSHCADIMAAHGGSIELLASDRGARFAIRLPRHERTVLIVDDQAAHRAMIRASIARVGSYDILEAANGRDALDLVEGTLPDIAVIDLEMPTMDGRLLIEALRSREDTRDLPIIVATSYLHGDVDTVAALTAELVGLGANHVAVKPIHSENFNRTFLHLMGDVGGA